MAKPARQPAAGRGEYHLARHDTHPDGDGAHLEGDDSHCAGHEAQTVDDDAHPAAGDGVILRGGDACDIKAKARRGENRLGRGETGSSRLSPATNQAFPPGESYPSSPTTKPSPPPREKLKRE